MTFNEWLGMMRAHEQLRAELERQRPDTSCKDCGHFQAACKRCEWHGIEPVPAQGIAKGCDDFSAVPF